MRFQGLIKSVAKRINLNFVYYVKFTNRKFSPVLINNSNNSVRCLFSRLLKALIV